MRVRVTVGVLLTLLLAGLSTLDFSVVWGGSEAKTIVVPRDYKTIQAAIDAASYGDTVFVLAGIYEERIVVNKSIALVGENRNTTIIDGKEQWEGTVVRVTAPDVMIRGFTIRKNGPIPDTSILIDSVKNVTILDNDILTLNQGGDGVKIRNSNASAIVNNNITNHDYGIVLGGSHATVIFNNTITDNEWFGIDFVGGVSSTLILNNNITDNQITGISIDYSNKTTIINNNLLNNYHGIFQASANTTSIINNNISGGLVAVELWWSHSDTIFGNNLRDNAFGVYIYRSSFETVFGNNITNSSAYGIAADFSSSIKIYHNNLLNNQHQVDMDSVNILDDGYPSGGNYWDDYAGVDYYSGAHQNITGSDGIGDTHRIIDANNLDNYPLMAPYREFYAYWENETYPVSIISNSTISEFYFSQPEKMIGFNVTSGEENTGFCRVAIPKTLLWSLTPDQWTVWLNNQTIPFTLIENDNYTFLYFTHPLGTKAIRITGANAVPEFPSTTILLTLMVTTLIAIIQTKKKPRKVNKRQFKSISVSIKK